MKVIVVANQKGGSAKTTLSAHLAWAAAEAKKRVLLIDLDPQANLGALFKSKEAQPDALHSVDLFAAPSGRQPERVTSEIHILRATPELTAVPPDRETSIARKHMHALDKQFDLAVIDVPPGFGILQMAGLAAADFVVTPTGIGLLEIEGTRNFMATFEGMKKLRPAEPLKHLGILPVRNHKRRAMDRALLAKLRGSRKDVFELDLPDRAGVPLAIAKRKPVWAVGAEHKSAGEEWRAACQEIFSRMKFK